MLQPYGGVYSMHVYICSFQATSKQHGDTVIDDFKSITFWLL